MTIILLIGNVGRSEVTGCPNHRSTDPPYTTVKLRICYALTPEKDTEVILHDGYVLPEIDRWWERAQGSTLALPLPAEAQAAPESACEVAA